MNLKSFLVLSSFVLLIIALAACSSPAPSAPVASAPTQSSSVAPSAGMANPASVFCGQNGGKTEIRKTATGEVGYCIFPDKSECEEFAFMRGECKPGAKPTTPASSSAASATTFTDAFAYCAAVGNIDTTDARWTGAKIPDAVLDGLITAAQLSSMPKELVAQQSFWRCMNNKVYGCVVGANLPCQEKADTNKTPAAALNDFCKANPNATVIPAAVTGRATVYEWKCVSGTPQIVRQLFTPDARGFLSDFWYELKSSTAAPGSSIANPASTFCVQNGGKLEIRKTAAGEVGICVFADKSECEEWAYMRGECKPGAKPTAGAQSSTPAQVGMANPASVFCVQNGGKSEIRKDPKGGEIGYCVFTDKSECEEWSFQRGECKPGAATVQIAAKDNGKTVNAAKGNIIVVTLEGNPGSTGYVWGLESGADTVLKPIGDFSFKGSANMPGASGKFEFKFTAVGAGNAVLKFANKRPWELNDPQAQTFTVTVTVK